MRGFMEMMPVSCIELRKSYKAKGLGGTVRLEAGKEGWIVHHPDCSFTFEDVDDTAVANMNKALMYAMESYILEECDVDQKEESEKALHWKEVGRMKNNDIELFKYAFRTNCAGRERTCVCGRRFYDSDIVEWGWNEDEESLRELQDLESDQDAVDVGHPVGTVEIYGNEYCIDCDCWYGVAGIIINFMMDQRYGIRMFYKLKKDELENELKLFPDI